MPDNTNISNHQTPVKREFGGIHAIFQMSHYSAGCSTFCILIDPFSHVSLLILRPVRNNLTRHLIITYRPIDLRKRQRHGGIRGLDRHIRPDKSSLWGHFIEYMQLVVGIKKVVARVKKVLDMHSVYTYIGDAVRQGISAIQFRSSLITGT